MIPFSLFSLSGVTRLLSAALLLIILWLAVGWAVALP